MARILNTEEFSSVVENGKGVAVVDFFAVWCGPCKMLAPVFESLSEEIEGAEFVKVDIDQSLELAQKYQIVSVPTMMIFKDGNPVDKLVGFVPKEQIKSKVEAYI